MHVSEARTQARALLHPFDGGMPPAVSANRA